MWGFKRKTMRKRIYIASPYTIGSMAMNVERHMRAAAQLMEIGFAPFAPLLSHFQDIYHPMPYETWMEVDLIWLAQCDAVLRLPGESKGADLEVAEAKRLGIPVFYQLTQIVEHFSWTLSDNELTMENGKVA